MPKNIFAVTILVAALLTGCSGGSSGSGSLSRGFAGGDPGLGNVTPPPAAYQMVPLTWESSVAGSQQWSNYLFNLILTQSPALMNGATDVTLFCSNYAALSNDQRANFWAYLLSEVALYESADNPINRYVETTMGTDPVTGKQVVSEGLLQLSYQDQLNYPFCVFDWAADSKLSPTDPNKTILEPYINLHCGALILNQQVQKHGAIAISSGAYWSTLKLGSQYNKLAQIESATQKLPFCAKP
jgi:hypothetical protein